MITKTSGQPKMTYWDGCPADIIHIVIHYGNCYTTSWDPPLGRHVAEAARRRLLADSSAVNAPVYVEPPPGDEWSAAPVVSQPCLPAYLTRQYYDPVTGVVDWIRAASEYVTSRSALAAARLGIIVRWAVQHEADHVCVAYHADLLVLWHTYGEHDLLRQIGAFITAVLATVNVRIHTLVSALFEVMLSTSPSCVRDGLAYFFRSTASKSYLSPAHPNALRHFLLPLARHYDMLPSFHALCNLHSYPRLDVGVNIYVPPLNHYYRRFAVANNNGLLYQKLLAALSPGEETDDYDLLSEWQARACREHFLIQRTDAHDYCPRNWRSCVYWYGSHSDSEILLEVCRGWMVRGENRPISKETSDVLLSFPWHTHLCPTEKVMLEQLTGTAMVRHDIRGYCLHGARRGVDIYGASSALHDPAVREILTGLPGVTITFARRSGFISTIPTTAAPTIWLTFSPSGVNRLLRITNFSGRVTVPAEVVTRDGSIIIPPVGSTIKLQGATTWLPYANEAAAASGERRLATVPNGDVLILMSREIKGNWTSLGV